MAKNWPYAPKIYVKWGCLAKFEQIKLTWKKVRGGSYFRHFQRMMTSSGGNDVINHAEIFTRDANSYLVHTGKISFWLDKNFKSYQKISFRGGPRGPPQDARGVKIVKNIMILSRYSTRKIGYRKLFSRAWWYSTKRSWVEYHQARLNNFDIRFFALNIWFIVHQ